MGLTTFDLERIEGLKPWNWCDTRWKMLFFVRPSWRPNKNSHALVHRLADSLRPVFDSVFLHL